ncbi:trypsin domain-containing protein [Ditylenchus destructor]|uniref:Trypsin domain-containing protein n=1 Tax=Ditylenchus destructor TaxID=166010 RepID=A0AAD4MPF6_9BILA|nr:trypsin domain-containing protein [Ditylenchus destructor]
MIGGMFYSLWLLIGIWFIGDHSQKLQSHTSCGFTPIKPDLSQNVSQTHDAVPYSWPWMVLVCETTEIYELCKQDLSFGTVVGEKWVLAFGYDCTSDGIFEVYTKLYDRTTILNPPAKTFQVKNVYCNDGHMAFTIILLELSESIEFDRFVQPICLPMPEENPSKIHGNIAWVSGWSYYSDGDWCNKLQQATVISNVSDVDPETILYVKRKANVNQFYYGSPLMRQRENKRWYQHGIWSMSFGATKSNLKSGYRKSIANDEKIDFYTRIEYYCDWIKETTNGEVLCS